MFLTSPLLWPRLFEKKAAAGKKFSGSLFFQKFCSFWKKNVKKLTVFSSFQCLHNEKSPQQAKKFWGHFFQKIDVFRKILRFLAVFNGFLAVFSASTTKKALCAPEARKKFSDLIFILVRHPPWKNLAMMYEYGHCAMMNSWADFIRILWY